MNIYLYPQAELLGAWARARALFCPDAEEPIRCLRCGGLLRDRLVENALSRAVDVHICPACGMDEALRDANVAVLPGRKWWTTWHLCQGERATGTLAGEIDDFQESLLALPELQTLWSLRRMCQNYAGTTTDPTEFNLYAETGLLYVWLRLITREQDYNLYCHFYQKDGGARTE